MNVLLIGSGGREHAFAWKLSQSALLGRLFIAPGNAGTEIHGENCDVDPMDFASIQRLILEKEIKMIIVGPEAPLVLGIVDELAHTNPELLIVGPGRSGAQLEGSKAFAKQFMLRHAIPTASYCEFGAADLHEATKYLDSQSLPIVLKADGLAAGKGVIICADRDVAKKEISEMLAGKFGDASAKVVVEAFLDGLEFSVFAVTDGESYRLLPVAKDYKRIGEGDTGLNTGGMGSISPVPFVDQAMMDKVEERIVRPTIAGIKSDGLDYKGFLFFGLIEVDGDPFVIEYNCRMGDPETQSVFPRIQNDLLELCIKIANRGLKDTRIDIDAKTVATVVMVSGGYPGSYEKGKPIEGLNNVENSLVFHAATKNENGQLLSSGGRVLAITSYGQNMKEALAQSYNQIKRISFDDAYYRADIGFDL